MQDVQMPRYDASRLEPKWQQYWKDNATFRTGPFQAGREKLYALDMFPYPSGSGLHVGHPEGYTATDIVCRYSRMRGRQVLHPMGWDAFGLPAEEHAIKTGTHPAVTTSQNIDTFRRQLQMLGFSYDWDREFATTDPDYYRWTQWIFLQIFDTWYDSECEWTGPDGQVRKGRGRPIRELPVPADVAAQGEDAVRRFQDAKRLAYQHEAPVNWCPALGTVLANEEVIDGKSERGGHPVERVPLRQWMLRITAYGDRLLTELDDLSWSESIKEMQRNWIGRSTGAEVDFYIGTDFEGWKKSRVAFGFPQTPGDDSLRIYTTRPDTLYGATYMVIAPEHSFVERLTTAEQREAVQGYVRQSSLKSDLDRTDLAKDKTGVFTGSHAINPVNGERVPIWVADYVLVSYGTGAIMAVPAHDERDFEFAKNYDLPIRPVVKPKAESSSDFIEFAYRWIRPDVQGTNPVEEYGIALRVGLTKDAINCDQIERRIREDRACPENFDQRYLVYHGADGLYLLAKPVHQAWFISSESYLLSLLTAPGATMNCGEYADGIPTDQFKARITADLNEAGLARGAVNFKLRDWLFSRQRYWGEPFPVWHELDADGNPTGLLRVDEASDLPILLPEMEEFKPTGTPDPMLSKAPEEWLHRTAADGTRLKRETNTMPQWAGSCWYYLRFADPKNTDAFIDPEVERNWLPVDLYVGGAEHAVLHLLYARFWHKVLFDRGHVHTCEPFQKLVNQGMILGEPVHYVHVRFDSTGWRHSNEYLSVSTVTAETRKRDQLLIEAAERGWGQEEFDRIYREYPGGPYGLKQIPNDQVYYRDNRPYWNDQHAEYELLTRAEKMSKSRGNVINPDDVVREYGADSLRMYEMFMGPLEQVKPWSMSGVEGVYRFLGRVWRMITDEEAETVSLHPSVQDVPLNEDQDRVLHRTIRAVTEDIEKLSFNTAISRMMEFTNAMSPQDVRPKAAMEPFVKLLSPFAPHIAEELWEVLGHTGTLAYEPWPEFDEAKIAESEIEIPVQVNGKLRAKIRVPAEADSAAIEAAAKQNETIAGQLEGRTIVKSVVVPGRLVNFVVR